MLVLGTIASDKKVELNYLAQFESLNTKTYRNLRFLINFILFILYIQAYKMQFEIIFKKKGILLRKISNCNISELK